jgi:hypothetical protein
MKLVLCKDCGDIIRLISEETRHCGCGKCSGRYKGDRLNAWYMGESAVPLGIANISLSDAVINRPKSGAGEYFKAFVVPIKCHTFVRRKKK